MGAEEFNVISSGKNAQEAFNKAVEQAQYDYGHRGYTGTIAEKDSFIMIKPDPGQTIDDLMELVDDKWGPAGCIDLGDGKYRFFGWASS